MRSSAWLAVGVVLLALFIAHDRDTSGVLVDFYDDGTHVAQRSGLNIISGVGVNVTSTDAAVNNRVNFAVNLRSRSGAVTLTNLATSTVAHGLGTTPDRVLLTPQTNLGGMSFWVSDKGSTTFLVNLEAASSTASFDWRAFSED